MGYAANIDTAYLQYQVGREIYKWDSVYQEALFQAKSGTWAIGTNANDYLYNYVGNSSPAIGDICDFGAFVVPVTGTYTFYAIGTTANNQAIWNIYINGSNVATIDWYSAGEVRNVAKSVTLGSLTQGVKCLEIRTATKNGSSSNYGCQLQAMAIVRA